VKIIHQDLLTTVEENNNFYFRNILLKMAALVAIFGFSGCRQPDFDFQKLEIKKKESMLMKKTIFFKNKVYPEATRIAENGDIITRMGTDITSIMLSKINPTDSSYSHCGIISIENDSVFVYHSIGGEFNPNQKLRRDPLYIFALPADCKRLGIFRPTLTKSQQVALCAYVKKIYKIGLPFDMDFDLDTDDRQYCTEMVAKSIGTIIGRKDWVATLQSDSFRFIPVENIYHNPMVTEKKRFVY